MRILHQSQEEEEMARNAQVQGLVCGLPELRQIIDQVIMIDIIALLASNLFIKVHI